jgi:hypothetical protein
MALYIYIRSPILFNPPQPWLVDKIHYISLAKKARGESFLKKKQKQVGPRIKMSIKCIMDKKWSAKREFNRNVH